MLFWIQLFRGRPFPARSTHFANRNLNSLNLSAWQVVWIPVDRLGIWFWLLKAQVWSQLRKSLPSLLLSLSFDLPLLFGLLSRLVFFFFSPSLSLWNVIAMAFESPLFFTAKNIFLNRKEHKKRKNKRRKWSMINLIVLII